MAELTGVPPIKHEEIQGLRILSLDGGGIRGLSSLLILKYLMQTINAATPPRPCEVFDLIGGTSTGGLIAIMLGRFRMTVDQAIDAYLELASKVFKPKHTVNIFATAMNLSKAKGRCDSKALEEAIRTIAVAQLGPQSEEALMLEPDNRCRSFVCAIRRERRSLICFRSYPMESALDLQAKVWEAARATSAATTFFDPIEIGKFRQEFVDGGGGYNNPIQVAVDEAEKIWTDRGKHIELLISIGTGRPAMRGFGNNVKEVAQTLIDIATEADSTWAQFVKHHPQYPATGDEQCAFRFQVERGMEDIGLAEHEKIKDIAAATQHYMEDEHEVGSKNLRQFKKIYLRSQNSQTISKKRKLSPSSDNVINTEALQHVMQHATLLEAEGLPYLLSTNTDEASHSSITISLPDKLFKTSDEIPFTEPRRVAKDDLIWPWLILHFNGPEGAQQCRVRIAAAKAVWCPDYRGEFAFEIYATEIWRLITTGSYFYLPERSRQPPGELYLGSVKLYMQGNLRGLPLVRLSNIMRLNKMQSGSSQALVPSEKLAQGICYGTGLEPARNRFTGERLFSSSAVGWQVVAMPYCLAFTLIPEAHCCFLTSQVDEATDQTLQMLQICDYLWDHADSVDCNDNDVPIKILFEIFRAPLRNFKERAPFRLGQSALGIARSLHDRCSERLEDLRTHGEPIVEIEDAFNLLQQASHYEPEDREFLDDDGTNNVVQQWWAFFGPERARWVALMMTLTLCINLSECWSLPAEFEQLFQHPSEKCYVI